ncbi:uncharacterized protein EI97DRAFT_461161 [Westerdykella ornata]|uniref:Low temperature requirement A n=1 Tax=Westerdykella ornata TaxID=318751 RepID=A0A6A6JCC1_WESOR|nr:uncharacterized protein EI97DRAFT_461161 [Westerdykella ornata]KAF2273276.1 hypothetical protein EI97DRAFT_461161 [Westerdykella ornata]
MGITLHASRKRDVDAEKHLKRLHKTVPIIESPLTGADHEHLVFSQRHEANTVELFFDLFFVANLATFTTYHSVTDSKYLLAYIGFFGILWSCWFQVTLHDVRFARDSLYERVCKTVQFIVFVGLALVGSNFNPGTSKGSNTNFRILCYTLVISRALLAVQYVVVLFYTARARYSKLFLPLGLMILIYCVCAAIFGAMTPAFRKEEEGHPRIYVVWYIVMLFESIAVIAISCNWRMLSFKKTHLMERMSLLTLIVIGEGAIGVTKTVSRLMGKDGLDVEGCLSVMCIIALLVLLWALYFDNFPHGHYGTIRQQIWSLLHFPFQLAIVGVVEGAQQVSLARYVLKHYENLERAYELHCLVEHLDGAALRDTFMAITESFKFEYKLETVGVTARAAMAIYAAGNATGICSPENAQFYIENPDEPPVEFVEWVYWVTTGLYAGLGIKIPMDKLKTTPAAVIAIHSFKVVYAYYWSSFCILMACSIAFLFLIRRHKVDLFDFVSVIARLLALAIGAILLIIMVSETALYSFIASPGVLPTCLALLFLVLFFDRISAAFCNWRLKSSGQPYALEYSDSHHHEKHDGDHDVPHDPLVPDHRKSAAWSIREDAQPLTAETAYYPPSEQYALGPVSLPPPMHSPPPVVGGYDLADGRRYGDG